MMLSEKVVFEVALFHFQFIYAIIDARDEGGASTCQEGRADGKF